MSKRGQYREHVRVISTMACAYPGVALPDQRLSALDIWG
jgi:hypothetical protein